ncbi:MAG: zinc ribbon domain-containing protein [Butyrivibrio sp.]|nr:zinc ribbon domain-containing protein [Butyrivibrio sp.]
MTKYNISGNVVTISTEVENERYLINETAEYINSVEEIFESWYSSQGNCHSVIENESVISDFEWPILQKAVELLNAQGVYSLDEIAFYDKYVIASCADDNYQRTINDMKREVGAVDIRREEEKMYRDVRKASRGRVQGGGFGVGGMLKGMATAGMMNAATGIAHSAANAAGNIGSSISASSDKAAIFKKYREPLKTALLKDLHNIRSAIRIALKKEAGIVCKYVSVSESDKANAIWNNYRLGRIPAEKKKEQIIDALTLNPYNLKIYISIWEDYGDKNGELRKMAAYFQVPLEEQIEETAEKYGNDLFTKNCSLYEKAFNKKAAAVQIEDQIKRTLDNLVQYCQERTISEDNISKIAQCKHLLEEIDIEIRTVRGITYDTRELAANIRKDFDTFYRTLQGKDIFESGTFEYVESAEYLTEEFRNILESVFGTEYGLRTPEKIYDNMEEIMKESLGDAIIGKGWIHIPGYIGSFSEKEPMICNILGNLGEELILAFFDRSAKGKSGVLITSQFLRIYAKGFLSNENAAYPIEQIEKIECKEADTYIVTLNNQNPISFSMKRGDMEADEQIAFGNMLNDLVRIVNNFPAKSRKQLYRLYKHTKICRCGMLLLPDERICPSCKWMIKDNGEFVETQICPNCNNYIQKGKNFCSICGYQIEGNGNPSNDTDVKAVQDEMDEKAVSAKPEELNTDMTCPNCHNMVKPNQKFCSKCGAKIQ